jgi:hypothetical protein
VFDAIAMRGRRGLAVIGAETGVLLLWHVAGSGAFSRG